MLQYESDSALSLAESNEANGEGDWSGAPIMPDSGTARAAALVGRDGTRCDGANPVSNTGQDRTPQSAHHPVMRAAEVTQDWRQVASKRDVVLEVWVDVQRSPISIRLSGTLDRGTATNLAALVEELIAEGGHEFKLETPALHLCDSGVAALAEVQDRKSVV